VQHIFFLLVSLLLTTPSGLAVSSCENSFVKVSDAIREVTNKDKTFLPPSMVTGPLQKRMDAFAKLYPKNVSFVDEVTFKHNRLSGKRKVLMISLDGLTAAKKSALQKDYLKYISDRTISFPLGESPGHLYTRIGAKTADFISQVSDSTYRLSSNERVETLVELSSKEFEKTQAYVKNAKKDVDNTIGGFQYDGVKGRTEGKINSNKPLSSNQGHNCTSWICSAPIGDKGESLYELSGASMKQEVHTSPGWWSVWLAAGAADERVPFVVYWTNEPMKIAKDRRIKAGRFNWDFNPH
jgi:hypothetical protein